MNIHRKYVILAVVSSLLIALDQLTKIYIHTQFQLGEQLIVIKDFFDITYVRNTGAAFGILRESHEGFRTLFFLSMPPIALVIIFMILRGVKDDDNWQIFALSSIFGGAIGNYIDRLRFGYVIDFIYFHWKEVYYYPAFNVADSSIVTGVTILILIMLRQSWEEARAKKQQTGA